MLGVSEKECNIIKTKQHTVPTAPALKPLKKCLLVNLSERFHWTCPFQWADVSRSSRQQKQENRKDPPIKPSWLHSLVLFPHRSTDLQLSFPQNFLSQRARGSCTTQVQISLYMNQGNYRNETKNIPRLILIKLFSQALLVWAYSLLHCSKNYSLILLKFHSLIIRWSDTKTNKLDKIHTYYILKYIYAIQQTHAFAPAAWHMRTSKVKTKAHAQELYMLSQYRIKVSLNSTFSTDTHQTSSIHFFCRFTRYTRYSLTICCSLTKLPLFSQLGSKYKCRWDYRS